MIVTLQAHSLVENAEPVQVRFTLCLRDQQSKWIQDDGCKVYMDSYMASDGSCFMVTWILFKNHLLEVGPTQNQETMALRTLTTVDLFDFTICEDTHDIEIAFGWGPSHIWLHTTLEGPWPHYMILEVSWDNLWTSSFGLSQFHGRALGSCVKWPLVECLVQTWCGIHNVWVWIFNIHFLLLRWTWWKTKSYLSTFI